MSRIKLDLSRIRFLGRQEELKQLNEALQRAAAYSSDEEMTTTGETIFIEAPSGTGKSALVQHFLSSSRHKNADLVCGRGKYDDDEQGGGANTASPFSTMEDSICGLAMDLVERAPEIWRNETVQNELFLLSFTFPRIRQLMKERGGVSSSPLSIFEDSTLMLGTEDQQRGFERLKFSLRSFIRACAASNNSAKTVVLLFYDDLQWASQQDLKLIQTLAEDSQAGQRRFLLIASHRPVRENHPLVKVKESLLSEPSSRNLFLGNLKMDQIAELLASLLRRDEQQDITELATVIHRKTDGNPFFAIQLLQLMERNKLFTYSMSRFRLEWDMDRILSEVNVSDNVVDLVSTKLRHLLSDIQQQVLVTASCLGTSIFRTDVLCAALSRDPTDDDFVSSIKSAVADGFLEEIAADGRSYKFAHDRIRESAYSLVAESKKAQLHVTIGRRLWKLYTNNKSWSISDSEYLLLQTIRQLNLGLEQITARDEIVGVVEMNAKAGQIAMQRSCFFSACDFLRTGRRLLLGGENNADAWRDHYALTTQLTTALSRAEFCCGRIHESILLCDEVLENVKSVDDKQDVFLTKIHCLINQKGTLKDTVQIGYVACQELGYPFPMRFLFFRIPLEIARIKKMLRGMSDEQLKNLPDAQDERICAALEMYQTAGEVAINGVPPNEMLGNMIMLRATFVTLKYGRAPMTGSCLIVWGWVLHTLGEPEEAYRFGEIGLHYANQRRGGREDSRAKLLYCSVIGHIKRSYHELIDVASDALKDMWAKGAVAYVCWDTFIYLRLNYSAGLPLKPLSLEIETYAALLRDYDNKTYYNNQVPYFQLVANLRGEAQGAPSILTGEYMNQSEFLVNRRNDGNNMSLQAYYFARLMAAYLFNEITLAEEMASQMGPNGFEGPETFVPLRYFYQAMTALGLYKISRRRKYLKRGNSVVKHFRKMMEKGLMVNIHPMLLVLEAEKSAVSRGSSPDAVRKSFDNAITVMSKLGILHHQALANERAGVFFLGVDGEWAKVYLTRAQELYLEWGAIAKVKEMDSTYAKTLGGSSSGMILSPEKGGGQLRGREQLAKLTTEELKKNSELGLF